MEIYLSEIIDRMTILRLKIEHQNNPSFNEELKILEDAIKEFEKRGIKIKQEWFDELYRINKYQWGLEASLREIKEKKMDIKELGIIYIRIQISNKARMSVKNKISEETGSGFRDIKIN